MGSRERRARERAETRERILEAARELFVRRGYEATTMRAIAERVEYTPTAIYHHFRDKAALLTELAGRDFRALAQAFQRIGKVSDAIERLGRICDTYVAFALEHPMHYQLMFMTRRPATPPGATIVRQGDPSEDAYAYLVQACRDAIESGRLRPEYTDAHELAQMLWPAAHGLVSLHIVKEHDDWIDWRDVRRTARRAGEALVRGLMRDTVA